jgi:hypothetical protein
MHGYNPAAWAAFSRRPQLTETDWKARRAGLSAGSFSRARYPYLLLTE